MVHKPQVNLHNHRKVVGKSEYSWKHMHQKGLPAGHQECLKQQILVILLELFLRIPSLVEYIY